LNETAIAFATSEHIGLLTPDGRLLSRFHCRFRENDVAFQFAGLSWRSDRAGLLYCGHQARRWMHLFSTNLDGSRQQRLFPDPERSALMVHSPACAADGRIALVLGAGAEARRIELLDPSSGASEALHSAGADQTLGSPTWLGPGNRLAWVQTVFRGSAPGAARYEGSQLELRDLRGGPQTTLLAASHHEALEQIRAAPDGRRLAVLRRRELELLGGRTYSEWTQGIANPKHAEYLRKIARQLHPIPLEQRSLNLYDLGLREERSVYRGAIEAFDWSPQGELLVLTDGATISLIEPDGPTTSIYRCENDEVRALAWAN